MSGPTGPRGTRAFLLRLANLSLFPRASLPSVDLLPLAGSSGSRSATIAGASLRAIENAASDDKQRRATASRWLALRRQCDHDRRPEQTPAFGAGQQPADPPIARVAEDWRRCCFSPAGDRSARLRIRAAARAGAADGRPSVAQSRVFGCWRPAVAFIVLPAWRGAIAMATIRWPGAGRPPARRTIAFDGGEASAGRLVRDCFATNALAPAQPPARSRSPKSERDSGRRSGDGPSARRRPLHRYRWGHARRRGRPGIQRLARTRRLAGTGPAWPVLPAAVTDGAVAGLEIVAPSVSEWNSASPDVVLPLLPSSGSQLNAGGDCRFDAIVATCLLAPMRGCGD